MPIQSNISSPYGAVSYAQIVPEILAQSPLYAGDRNKFYEVQTKAALPSERSKRRGRVRETGERVCVFIGM